MESSTAQFLLRQSACVQLPMIVTIVIFTLTGICVWDCFCSIAVATPLQNKFGKCFARRGGLLKFLFRRLGSIAHQLPFAGLGHLILMAVAGGLGNGLLLVDITNHCELTLSTHAAILLSEYLHFLFEPPSFLHPLWQQF